MSQPSIIDIAKAPIIAYNEKDYNEARRLYQASLERLRKLGDRQWIAVMLYNLGELEEIEEDLPAAVVLFTHSERIFREIQSAMVVAPAEKLQAIQNACSNERWKELQSLANEKNWEQTI